LPAESCHYSASTGNVKNAEAADHGYNAKSSP
jgi:hypothetical protein